MKLSELFTALSYGVLSNLSIGSDGAGTIQTGKEPVIVQHTNEALLKIFSRFVLYEKDLIIQMSGNRTQYPLLKKYAESTDDGGTEKFIKDGLHDIFTGDVIKILEVFDYIGNKMVLNDAENPYSLFTPQPTVLMTTRPMWNVAYSVAYQARHAVITGEDDEAEIDIPFVLESALQNYIGYLVFSNMTGQEHLVKSQELLGKYETTCLEIEQKDILNQSFTTTNTKFAKRGFI